MRHNGQPFPMIGVTASAQEAQKQVRAVCTEPVLRHLSYDACLEVRGAIIGTVLCCIVY